MTETAHVGRRFGRGDADDLATGPDTPTPSAERNPFVDGRMASLRGASAGPQFDEELRSGESGNGPGLVAGSRDDPLLVDGIGYPLLGGLSVGTVAAYRVVERGIPEAAPTAVHGRNRVLLCMRWQ